MKPIAVLAGNGINCERETAAAFQFVGGQAEIVPLFRWIEDPNLLERYSILVFPGGFSYGDELHSGQILSLFLKFRLDQALSQFWARGGLGLGICNGFQVLMKLGVFEEGPRRMTLTHNIQNHFIDRWVKVHVPQTASSPWLKGLEGSSAFLPIRHGEGRIAFDPSLNSENALHELGSKRALQYADDVNGSAGRLAGLTSLSGRIFGLMPHPEAAFFSELYPWEIPSNPEWTHTIFKNAITEARGSL